MKIDILQYDKAATACVVVEIPIKADPLTLIHLKNNFCSPHPEFDAATVVLYSIHDVANQKLDDSPFVAKKTKALNVDCSISNGKFLITFQTKPTFSDIRKCCNFVLKCMFPSKTYPVYDKNVRRLGSVPNRDDFEAAAKFVAAHLSKLDIVVVAKMKTTPEKIKELNSAMKFDVEKGSEGKYAGKYGKDYPSVSCNGASMVFIANYLENAGGLTVIPGNNELIIADPNIETKLKNLSDKHKISVFCSKYAVLKDQIGEASAHYAALNGLLGCAELSSLHSKKIDPAEIVKLISAYMK